MRALLLYDADCGFCTKTVAQLPRLRLDLDVASIQETDLGALGVDEERAHRQMPVVDPRGDVTYGHEAWATALGTGSLPLRLVGRVLGSKPMRRPAAATYDWVAANRDRLPGGTAACTLEPAPHDAR